MTIFLFLDKCLKALNSDVVKFSDKLRSLAKLPYEDKAVSSNLASIKDKCSLYKFPCFASRDNNAKDIKHFAHLGINLGFTVLLRPLHNTLFS